MAVCPGGLSLCATPPVASHRANGAQRQHLSLAVLPRQELWRCRVDNEDLHNVQEVHEFADCNIFLEQPSPHFSCYRETSLRCTVQKLLPGLTIHLASLLAIRAELFLRRIPPRFVDPKRGPQEPWRQALLAKARDA